MQLQNWFGNSSETLWRFQNSEIQNWFQAWHAKWFFREVYKLFRSKNSNKKSKQLSFIDSISQVLSGKRVDIPPQVKSLTLKDINDFFRQTLWASNKWDFLEKLWIINMETRRRFDPSTVDYSPYIAAILANYSLKTWIELKELINSSNY